ncbi:MAG TPA: M23 family metallopeptidase [Anaeromyxobacter sp.]
MRRAAALAALASALAACPAPRTALRPPPPPEGPRAPPLPLAAEDQHDEPALAGVVHVVRRGETIYRIARAYGIDPTDLMETNGVADPRTVAVGTELFVPGAPRVLEVPPAPVPGDPAHATATPPLTHASTSTSTTPTATRPPSPTSAHPERSAADGGAESKGAESKGDAPLMWPLKGVLYGRYGVRAGRRHDGIDIAAPEGTTVLAAAAGTIIYAGEQAGYGAIVIVRHENGLVTLYAHNARLLVGDGARVRRGEPIAKVGQTGRTTGPHLHFEVRDGTRPRNPLLYLP